MSDLKVLNFNIFGNKGKTIRCTIEGKNEQIMWRYEIGPNKYQFCIEEEVGDIDVTDIVNKEIKQIFSTIYHEQYNLKQLNLK